MPNNTRQSLDSIRTHAIELPLTNLQRAILQSGVKILNEDDKRVYQAFKLAKARAKAPRQPGYGAHICLCIAIFSVLFLSIKFDVGNVLRGLIVLLCVAAWVAILERDRRLRDRADKARLLGWRRYPVGMCNHGNLRIAFRFQAAGVPGYTEIPPKAKRICQQLADTGVTASFNVEQLDDDPFLVVLDGAESYCLFAWDEKGYVPR